MKTIAITLLFILTCGFQLPKKQTFIIGTITTKYKDYIPDLYIELRINKKVLALTKMENDRTFKISTASDEEFDIFYKGMGIGEAYVQSVKPSKNDSVYLHIQLPKKYKKHLGKTICPKCNKYDQTIPISYGLKTIVVYSKNQPSYTTYEEHGKEEVYDGGCSTSEIDSKYFCKRDEIKF